MITRTRTRAPEVTYRSWNFRYKRPRTGGWPLLTRTGWPQRGRKESRITPTELIIQVRQDANDQPAVSSIQARGTWTGTTLTASERIMLDARPGLAFTVYAPDWVQELAEDAVARATAEIGARA
jgi:hypothetical protein